MPSEKSRYRSRKPHPTASFSDEEICAVLESRGNRVLAQMILELSGYDLSLRHLLAAMVLKTRIPPQPSDDEIAEYLNHLTGLCRFEAEWRDRSADDAWARFLEEVVSIAETLLNRAPLGKIKDRLQSILTIAEESSWHIEEPFSCGLAIEKFEALLK
jgi:hypothetical protein